jgi:hypothetical protein
MWVWQDTAEVWELLLPELADLCCCNFEHGSADTLNKLDITTTWLLSSHQKL